MKSVSLSILYLFSTSLFLYGCATIFKGYEEDVFLTHLPQNTRVFSQDSIEIPILYKTKTETWVTSERGKFDSI